MSENFNSLVRQALSDEACADAARNLNPHEGNKSIAPVVAWYNSVSDPSDPCVLYSSSTWRLFITHRVPYCRRILLAAPIISKTIQAIILQAVLRLWSIPTIITTMMVDEMLEMEYDYASEALPGLRALHEWLLIWAEDERVHDSLGKIVVGVYWVVVVLMLYQPISVAPQPTQQTLESKQRILEAVQRDLETRSSSPPLHTNDDEPDTRVLEKHNDAEPPANDAEPPAMDDDLRNKTPTPAPDPTPEMILKAPSIAGAGGAPLTPDAHNRGLKTDSSSMRNKTNPPQNQEDRDRLRKEKRTQKQREKRLQKKEEKRLQKKEEKRLQKKEEQGRVEQERVEQGQLEQEKNEQAKKEQEKIEQKKRDRNRRGKK